ncbi:MAG TPA: hypothetical protein VFP65_18800, partial [Anaeromyxobacteraceae bacterium]|nr:hypothetical protein [Anaeromyxobacteraceae bacterium]
MSLARFPGVDLVGRVFAGPLQLTASADVALTFGGVEPLRMPPPAPPGTTYPLVQLESGYYHALGVYAAPGLEARLGPVAAGAEARLDRLFLDFKAP